MRRIHVHIHDGEWDESKHPRKDDGKFGTGGSAPAALTGRQRQALRRLDENTGRGPSLEVSEVWAEPETAMHVLNEIDVPHEKGTIKRLKLDDLIPTQDNVERSVVREYITGARVSEHVPLVVKDGGKYYLQDGHHRAVTHALLWGKQEPMEVRVVNMPKFKE